MDRDGMFVDLQQASLTVDRLHNELRRRGSLWEINEMRVALDMSRRSRADAERAHAATTSTLNFEKALLENDFAVSKRMLSTLQDMKDRELEGCRLMLSTWLANASALRGLGLNGTMRPEFFCPRRRPHCWSRSTKRSLSPARPLPSRHRLPATQRTDPGRYRPINPDILTWEPDG